MQIHHSVDGDKTGTGCPLGEVSYHALGDPRDSNGNLLPLSSATINARQSHAYCPVGFGREKIVDDRNQDIFGPNNIVLNRFIFLPVTTR